MASICLQARFLLRLAVVDDLLHTFSGLDGRYVRARLEEGHGGARLAYTLHGCPDAALHELTARMLPLWCVCLLSTHDSELFNYVRAPPGNAAAWPACLLEENVVGHARRMRCTAARRPHCTSSPHMLPL